jgi:hypothetical protein
LKASQLREILEEQEEAVRETKRQRCTSTLGETGFPSKSVNGNCNDRRGHVEVNGDSLDKTRQQVRNTTSSTTKTRTTTKVQFDTDHHISEPSGSTSASSPLDETSLNNGGFRVKFAPEQVSFQLRHFGLPVRLFGETDSGIVERLQLALSEQEESIEKLSEQDEYRLGRGHGIRNHFLEKEDEHTSTGELAAVVPHRDAYSNDKGGGGAASSSNPTAGANDDDDDNKDDGEDIKNDPHKRVYRYFRGLLKEWEADLLKRPDDVKRSVAGKNETKTVKQCKDYIRPLFKLCKNRIVEESMLHQLVKMVEFCEIGEFVRAHDAYMDVAIGRAAWPIGVTSEQ